MEPTIEQPTFDPLPSMEREVMDTADRTDLIDNDRRKRVGNGDNQGGENSPLHQRSSTSTNTSILCAPQNYGLRVIIVSSIVFALAVTIALILTIYLEPKEIRGHAAVVTSDDRCSELALDILKDGGNAVDAAVASSFCLAVVAPQYSGLGGGGFAIVHDHKFTSTYTYDFRATAPTGLTGVILELPGAETSITSTGIPGLVKGLAAMHAKHGGLPWKDLMSRSIEMAEEGFKVSKDLAQCLRKISKDQFQSQPFAKLFFKDGKLKRVNDTIQSADLAATLKQIQLDSNALYNGPLMDKFVKEMRLLKSTITSQDMQSYKVMNPAIIKSKLKDLTVLGMPAPAGGPLVSLILNMAQKFDWKKGMQNDTMTFHQLIETFKFAYAQYSLLGDPGFDPAIEDEMKFLLSDDLASDLASKVDNRSYSDPSHYGPAQPFTDHGTEHISVVDSSELMVSMTLSVNNLFGNKIVLPGTGILLNNEMMDFTMPQSNPLNSTRNLVQVGKRPQSCMSPTIIYNDDHPCDNRLIIGGRHGHQILTGVTESIINNLIFKMDLQKAIAAPRMHNQLFPMVTLYEANVPSQVVANLSQMGHIMEEANAGLSVVNAIEKSNDDLMATADPRGLGVVERY